MSELVLSWEQFHADTKQLAKRIRARDIPISAIVAVTRGGLAGALILSHELGIKYVDTLGVSSYDKHNVKGSTRVHKDITPAGSRTLASLLIVDDLVDTGETAKIARALFPNAAYAAVYAKPQGLEHCDVFARSALQDTWIVFPWER